MAYFSSATGPRLVHPARRLVCASPSLQTGTTGNSTTLVAARFYSRGRDTPRSTYASPSSSSVCGAREVSGKTAQLSARLRGGPRGAGELESTGAAFSASREWRTEAFSPSPLRGGGGSAAKGFTQGADSSSGAQTPRWAPASPHQSRHRAAQLMNAMPLSERSADPQRQRSTRPLSRRPVIEATTEEVSSDVASIITEALTLTTAGAVVEVMDDDVVMDTPASLLRCMATQYSTQELRRAHQRQRRSKTQSESESDASYSDAAVATPEEEMYAHPAARGVGQDVIDLVTDVFTAQRDAAVKRRRELLYDLTHPNPIDYTYQGKLVPPPPLSFGQISEEARSLGNKMMLGASYTMVRQAGTRASEDDFCAAAPVAAPSSSIETSVSGASSLFSARAMRTAVSYRSRAREDNVFRDHNYFFEVNELYQEIVLVGRACAGKSSLLNALLGQKVAKTSSSPNTTRKISFYQSVTPEQLRDFHDKEHHNQLVKLPGGGMQLTFVDMPGYGIEGMSDKWRDAAIELTDAYFGVRRSVNTVLYCMDCERGLTKTDMKYFEWLENVQGIFFVVLTKCDSVPHSRVTSVMRQVYTLITKNRRKYRKVFPFVIPTSARDGTNVEMLRGLITETSGMIPGDKLRDLLRRKKSAFTETALKEEAGRLDAVRELERAQAREFFQLTRGGGRGGAVLRDEGGEDASASLSTSQGAVRPPLSASAAQTRNENFDANQVHHISAGSASHIRHPEQSSFPARTVEGPRRYVFPLDKNDAGEKFMTPLGVAAANGNEAPFMTALSPEAVAAAARGERRERFLAWRRAHPLTLAENRYGASSLFDGAEDEKERGEGAGVGRGQREQAAQKPISDTGSVSPRVDGSAADQPYRSSSSPSSTTPAEARRGLYRLHTGLDNPQATQAVLDIPDWDEGHAGMDETDTAHRRGNTESSAGEQRDRGVASSSGAPPSMPARALRSSVIGFSASTDGVAATPTTLRAVAEPSTSSAFTSAEGGAVSQFLRAVEAFGRQPNVLQSAKQRRKEARWQRWREDQHRGGIRGGGGGLVAEDASGRLSPYQAGKVCGPALVSSTTSVNTRQAEWRAEQLKRLLAKENPEAPWLALHQLRRKLKTRQEDAALSGMRRKEVAAYVRDAGKVTECFEKFEGEVTAAKYMNEVRQAPTLRTQQQMHLNATAKINYRAMPPGLWKRYGEKDTYWPTPQVLGRTQDESHKP